MEIAPGIFSWMHPQERRARSYTAQGPLEKPLRPYQRVVELSGEEQAEIAALAPHEQRTRFRAIQTERSIVK